MTSENRNYSDLLRLTAFRHHRIKREKDPARRKELLEAFRDRTVNMRNQYRILSKEPEFKVIQGRGDDCESWTRIYKEPLCFEGTKAEAEEYLWENLATRIYSDYDCTGRPFTQWFTLGYLGGGKWKVAERMGLDV